MMQAGPELDALIATKVMGWTLWDAKPGGPSDAWLCWKTGNEDSPTWRCSGYCPSADLTTCAAAAEEARKAGKIDAWDVHQFETGSSSTGKLMPNGRTLAWADAVQGDTPAHALALALLKACGVDV